MITNLPMRDARKVRNLPGVLYAIYSESIESYYSIGYPRKRVVPQMYNSISIAKRYARTFAKAIAHTKWYASPIHTLTKDELIKDELIADEMKKIQIQVFQVEKKEFFKL